jgi:phenylacetate-coenzyme A ligase PaaK-like adenylate-forming protein
LNVNIKLIIIFGQSNIKRNTSLKYCAKIHLKSLTDRIFNITTGTEFTTLALDIFRFQAENNPVYKRYLQSLKVDEDSVKELSQIPFLPVEFFKSQQILSTQWIEEAKSINSVIFTSSGTTGNSQSKHYVSDVSLYQKSYTKAFEYFYGNITDYCFLALLPSYLEREGSSLIYMASDLIKKSGNTNSCFYLNNYDELIHLLKELKEKNQKTILMGVTYALLDLAEHSGKQVGFDNLIIMETGGMKGKRKEMVREELHNTLTRNLGVTTIHSEYGMTELLSQAYSKGNGLFECPPWMKIMIRDTNDPFTFLQENKTGGINVIDLTNINSCSFIATQDLGRNSGNFFEVLGRFDNSDIRGCNLLIQ